MVSCSILKIKRLINFYDRFQILTAVLLSVEVLVDMTPCHWGNTSFKTRRRVPELYNFTISYFLKKKSIFSDGTIIHTSDVRNTAMLVFSIVKHQNIRRWRRFLVT